MTTSHPTWVRGLKREDIEVFLRGGLHVAPYMGAWIETIKNNSVYKVGLSHPTWVRGLKLVDSAPSDAQVESHPTWVRGLKQCWSEAEH